MAEFTESHEQSRTHAPRQRAAAAGEHEGEGSPSLVAALGNAHVNQLMTSIGVQRAGATSAQQLDESVARAIEERRGRGRPLDDGAKADLEHAFGHDLSDVRVHTDSAAHELNEAVNARAFTTGEDVFFKQGAYEPGSATGRELLAHEVTHVVQQREGTSGLGPGEVSQPADAAEHAAATAGREVASQHAAGGVARQSEDDLDEPVARQPDAPSMARQAEEELDEEQPG